MIGNSLPPMLPGPDIQTSKIYFHDSLSVQYMVAINMLTMRHFRDLAKRCYHFL